MAKDKVYLNHILDSINSISKFTNGMDKKAFSEDEVVINAVIRMLEIIGEAANNISNELKIKYPNVPWKKITGTRNNLIHEYFNVDLDLIWKTITINLPELKEKVIEIIKKTS